MRRSFLALALAMLASSAFAGITYDYSSVTEGMAHTTIAGKVTIDGGKLRMDMSRGDGTLFRDNSIVLSADGGKTLRVLDPSTRTFYDLQADQLLGSADATLKQLGATLAIANQKVSVVDEGDGGKLEGFPTKKSRIDLSYDMNVDMMGQKLTTHMDVTTESWTTDKIGAEYTNFLQLRGTHSGIEGIDKLIEAQSGATKNGFPLKQVAVAKINAMVQQMTTTTTSTVTGVTTTTVAADRFAMPEGYTKTDNPLEKMAAKRK
jgi:hypothetical protein